MNNDTTVGKLVSGKTDDELTIMFRDFIQNEDGESWKLEDHFLRDWAELSPDDKLWRLAGLWNFSFSKQWAWDALKGVLSRLEDRREPIPELLKDWAVLVVVGKRPRPKANKDDRDSRIFFVYRLLKLAGVSHRKALDHLGRITGLKSETVRSAYRKMKDYTPDL